MSVAVRVIPCLDVSEGRVVKGVNFVDLVDAGDPVELAHRYDREGADELTFLDITATSDNRRSAYDMIRRTAEQVFIPLTVGGGVRTVADIDALLRAGADKVSVNSAAVARPEFLAEAATRFGSQCVVIAVDARRIQDPALRCPSGYEVTTHGGRRGTGIDAVDCGSLCCGTAAAVAFGDRIRRRRSLRQQRFAAARHPPLPRLHLPAAAGHHLAAAADAALGRLFGDATGLVLARIATIGAASAATVLLGRLVARHTSPHRGLLAAAVYAAAAPALIAGRTAMLEPWLDVALLVAYDRLGRRALTRRDAVIGGFALGAAVTVKAWGLLAAIVLLGWLLLRRPRIDVRTFGRIVAAACGAVALVCLPFFVFAPGHMIRDVITAQLGRPVDGTASTFVRWAQFLAVKPVFADPAVPVALATLVVAACAVGALRRGAIAWLMLGEFAAGIAMFALSPPYFFHYGDYLIVPLAALVALRQCVAVAATGSVRYFFFPWRSKTPCRRRRPRSSPLRSRSRRPCSGPGTSPSGPRPWRRSRCGSRR